MHIPYDKTFLFVKCFDSVTFSTFINFHSITSFLSFWPWPYYWWLLLLIVATWQALLSSHDSYSGLAYMLSCYPWWEDNLYLVTCRSKFKVMVMMDICRSVYGYLALLFLVCLFRLYSLIIKISIFSRLPIISCYGHHWMTVYHMFYHIQYTRHWYRSDESDVGHISTGGYPRSAVQQVCRLYWRLQ